MTVTGELSFDEWRQRRIDEVERKLDDARGNDAWRTMQAEAQLDILRNDEQAREAYDTGVAMGILRRPE